MIVRTVQRRFIDAIKAGVKTTTIRPSQWEIGRMYELRAWTGKAYRSKQEHVAFVTILAARPVKVTTDGVETYPVVSLVDSIAKHEGFASWNDMREWFITHHRKAMMAGGFIGYMMTWKVEV